MTRSKRNLIINTLRKSGDISSDDRRLMLLVSAFVGDDIEVDIEEELNDILGFDVESDSLSELLELMLDLGILEFLSFEDNLIG